MIWTGMQLAIGFVLGIGVLVAAVWVCGIVWALLKAFLGAIVDARVARLERNEAVNGWKLFNKY